MKILNEIFHIPFFILKLKSSMISEHCAPSFCRCMGPCVGVATVLSYKHGKLGKEQKYPQVLPRGLRNI